MKPRRFVLAILASLGLVITVAGCTSPTATTPPQAIPELTDVVAGLLAGAQPEGNAVTIVGYYRGWDLLGEANQAPPVTRSDWVIKDKSGAIYVQANAVEIEGLDKLASGEALRPGDRADTGHILRVSGFVRLARNSQYYIEPARIELVK